MQDEVLVSLNAMGYETFFYGQEDPSYPAAILRSADVIVTLPPGLLKLPRFYSGLTYLYTCNTHIDVKTRRLETSSKRWGLPAERIPGREDIIRPYCLADYLLIAENDAGIRNFIDNGIDPGKILRYSNCVDTDVWRPQTAKHAIFTFVCYGSDLGVRKGMPALVAAWRQWYSGQAARLLILGSPTEASTVLFGEGQPTGRSGGIEVNLGWRRPQAPETIDAISRSHVAVFPTLEDAQPSSLLEMASCGLPAITTVESGVEFPESFCRYVAADDPAALAAAFEHWFQRRDQLGTPAGDARAFILAHHDWPVFRQRFSSLIESTARAT